MEGIGTARIGPVDCKGSYEHSFGALKNRTRYADAWSNIDLRPQLNKMMSIGMKALESTTAGALSM